MNARLLTALVSVCFIAAVVALMLRTQGDEATKLGTLLAAVTLTIVAFQVLLNLEQLSLMKSQSKIIEKQDALLFGRASLWIYAPGVQDVGHDELAATEQLSIFVRNTGNRVAKGLTLRVGVPPFFELLDSQWTKLPEEAPDMAGYFLYERRFELEVWPEEETELGMLELRRSSFARTRSPLVWQLSYNDGITPRPGKFGVLETGSTQTA